MTTELMTVKQDLSNTNQIHQVIAFHLTASAIAARPKTGALKASFKGETP